MQRPCRRSQEGSQLLLFGQLLLVLLAAALPHGSAGSDNIKIRKTSTKTYKHCDLKFNVTYGSASSEKRVPLAIPVNDQWISGSICAYGGWEPELQQARHAYIREGSTVVDAGANYGSFTVQYSHWVGATGKVVSFEPQKGMFQAASANAIGFGLGNVELFNCAVGHKLGSLTMEKGVPDGDAVNKTFEEALKAGGEINYGGRGLGPGGEKVPIITLDLLNLKNISFIKVDVQGSENLFLYGARNTIKRELPAINLEMSNFFLNRTLSPEFREAMDIGDTVAAFDGISWLKSIGYEQREQIVEDVFLWHPSSPPPKSLPAAAAQEEVS